MANVRLYDIAFRKKAANRHLMKWADIDSALWNRAFSGKSNDSAFCRLCLDATHATVECPLYTAGPAQCRRTGPETDGGKSIRLNWNRGQCTHDPCHRTHVCATVGCGGNHRYSNCPKRRQSPRKSHPPTTQT